MSAARGFLGAGDLYIARFNPATSQFDDFQGPIESTKFEIKPKVDMKEMTSKGRSTYGQVIESVPIPKPFEFTVEFAEVSGETLVSAFLGTKTALNQGAGTMTNINVKLTGNSWGQTGHMNLATAGLTVKDPTGTTTYVLGTDYNINYRLGQLQRVEGGAIADGEIVKVSGSYNAVTGSVIAGGTNPQIRAMFRFDGKNWADNLPCIVDVFEAVIASDKAFDFLSNDFASVSLQGRLKTPIGKTEPFTVTMIDTVM